MGRFASKSNDHARHERIAKSDHDNLVRQERKTIGEIQDCLMCQLLGMIGSGTSLEDDGVARIDNPQIANSTVRNPVNMDFEVLGGFQVVLAESRTTVLGFGTQEFGPGILNNHASLPLDQRKTRCNQHNRLIAGPMGGDRPSSHKELRVRDSLIMRQLERAADKTTPSMFPVGDSKKERLIPERAGG